MEIGRDEGGSPIEKLDQEIKLVRGLRYSDGRLYRRWIVAYQATGSWVGYDDARVIGSVDAVLEMSALDEMVDAHARLQESPKLPEDK